MKKMMLTLLVGLMVMSSYAQELPKPSPLSTVSQVVGVTEVSLEYSRPGVKDRVIFGDLVPYGKIWRLGANASTKFTTADVLTFGKNTLKPGTYSLFAFPGENGTWEIAFNTDIEDGSTQSYTSEKDVFRVQAKAVVNSFTETLSLGFDNVKSDGAEFVILWENLRIAVPFTVNTNDIAMKNIDAAIAKGENLDEVYNNAANYYFSSLKDNKQALDLVEKSIAKKEGYRNLFLKARILGEMGEKAKAITLAGKALKLAEADGNKGYTNFISGTIDRWKK